MGGGGGVVFFPVAVLHLVVGDGEGFAVGVAEGEVEASGVRVIENG